MSAADVKTVFSNISVIYPLNCVRLLVGYGAPLLSDPGPGVAEENGKSRLASGITVSQNVQIFFDLHDVRASSDC